MNGTPGRWSGGGLRFWSYLAFTLAITLWGGAFAVGPTAAAATCTVSGSPGADVLRGTSRRDVICGRNGRDRLIGKDGNDVLIGGGGRDELIGRADRDRLVAGRGDDILRGGSGNDLLFGQPHDDNLRGGPGADLLDAGTGFNSCVGGPGADVLRANCEDRSPPTLSAFWITPTTINTDAGERRITLYAVVKDSQAGVGQVTAIGRGPGNYVFGESLYTVAENTFSRVITIPRYSRPGTYAVSGLTVTDRAGNELRFSGADLASRGFTFSFEQVGAGDSVAPVLDDFSLTPTTVDTSTSARQISASITATDDLAGIEYAWIDLVYPSGVRRGWRFPLVAGTVNNGTWSGSVAILQYSHPGTYAAEVELVDTVGNRTIYSTQDLGNAGFPAGFEQTGPGDTTPPTIEGFSFSPSSINTASGPRTITFSFDVTDDLSGISVRPPSPEGIDYINVMLEGPTGTFFAPPEDPLRQSGTDLNGVWTAKITIPQFAPYGTYTVTAISASDRIGNGMGYSGEELADAGFPDAITNGPGG